MSDQASVSTGVLPQSLKIDFRAVDFVFAQSDGEVPPPEQRSKPRCRFIRITIRCGITERRMTHAIEGLDDLKAPVGLCPGSAQCGSDKCKWPFELVTALQLKIRSLKQGAQGFADVPLGPGKSCGDCFNRRRGWIISNKPPAKLRRDMLRRRGMDRHDLQNPV